MGKIFDKPPIDELMHHDIDEDILMHYGMPRRSGRYPWGSGEDPYQHGSANFLSRVNELKKSGWEETPENIYKEFGLTTTQYRTEKALAKDEERYYKVAKAKSMKEDGLGATEIARRLSEEYGEHINESTVRSLLNTNSEARMKQAKITADVIREQINKRGTHHGFAWLIIKCIIYLYWRHVRAII